MVIMSRFDKDRDDWLNWPWGEISKPSKLQQLKLKKERWVMPAFWICRISQTLLMVTLKANNKISLTLIWREEEMFLLVFSSCQYFLFLVRALVFRSSISSFFFQAEGRNFPGIRELSPRSEHSQQASGVARKVHSTAAAHVEREGKCHVAVQHSDRVEQSSGCAL